MSGFFKGNLGDLSTFYMNLDTVICLMEIRTNIASNKYTSDQD